MGESPLFYCYMPVASKEEAVARIAEIAQRVGESEGIEIVDVEFLGAGRGGSFFIDRPRGLRIFIQTGRRASLTPIANLFRSR